MEDHLLEIENLTVRMNVDEGTFTAVDDVSFFMDRGEIVGLVGESGCGKSVTALSILRLLPFPPAEISSGRITFKGMDLLKTKIRDLQNIRGHQISMVFQEPASALSPLYPVGKQLVEALRFHKNISGREAMNVAAEWLRKVRIPDVEEKLSVFPYQMSGGMQQRVMIAMAMMLGPDLLIADEPTTALDVTIQAQIFELLREMKQQETSILLITHDMGAVWEMCDRVVVMYASRIAETGTREEVFGSPSHPYTKGLLNSIPRLNIRKNRLDAIPGQVPSPMNYTSGCHFRDRCPEAVEACGRKRPDFVEVSAGHYAACIHLENIKDE